MKFHHPIVMVLVMLIGANEAILASEGSVPKEAEKTEAKQDIVWTLGELDSKGEGFLNELEPKTNQYHVVVPKNIQAKDSIPIPEKFWGPGYDPEKRIPKLEIEWQEDQEGYRLFELHTYEVRNGQGFPDVVAIETPDQNVWNMQIPLGPDVRKIDVAYKIPFYVKAGKNVLTIRLTKPLSHHRLNLDQLRLSKIDKKQRDTLAQDIYRQKRDEEHNSYLGTEYNRAIVKEAELQDEVRQLRRMVLYAGRTDLNPSVEKISREAKSIQCELGAYRDNGKSNFKNLNYVDIQYKITALCGQILRLKQDVVGKSGPADVPQATPIKEAATALNRFTISMSWDGLIPNLPRLDGLGFSAVHLDFSIRSSREPDMFRDFVDRIIAYGYRHMTDIHWYSPIGAAKEMYPEDQELTCEFDKQICGGKSSKNPNVWNPHLFEGAARIIPEYVRNHRDLPGFMGYEVFNEPDNPFAGKEKAPRAAFAKWLEKEFGTIEKLNSAWQTQYQSFDQIGPPETLLSRVGMSREETGKLYQWEMFCSAGFNEYVKYIIELIRKNDPDESHMIIPEPIAGIFGSHHDLGSHGLDLYSYLALPWSAVSTHAWDGKWAPLQCLTTYSLAKLYKKPIWEDEWVWSSWERKGTPEWQMRGAASRNLWKKAAWGVRGVELFYLAFEWTKSGPSWDNSMLSQEDDLWHLRYCVGCFPMLEKKVNRIKDYYYGRWMRWQGLGMLQANTSMIVAAPSLTTRDEAGKLLSSLHNAGYRPLNLPEKGIRDGVVDLSTVKVLFTPYAPNMLETVSEKLLAWIKSGGVLIASGPVAVMDENGRETPKFLKEIFGIEGMRYAGKDVKRARDDNFNRVSLEKTGGRFWTIEGTPREDVQILSRYPDGSPQTLLATYGKGKVIMNAATFSENNRMADAVTLLNERIPSRMVLLSSPSNVDWTLWDAGQGCEMLFLFNNDITSESPVEVSLDVDGKYSRVFDMTVEPPVLVPSNKETGRTVFTTMVSNGEGVVFLLCP